MTTKEEIKDSVLFDDYFSEDGDPGVEVAIEHRGKLLLFRLRKSLTLGEKQDALAASLDMSLTKDGTPVINRMDNAGYTEAIVLKALKEWPFKYSEQSAPNPGLVGKPVPINAANVHKLDGTLAEKISNVVLGISDSQKEALAPFGMKFGAAS